MRVIKHAQVVGLGGIGRVDLSRLDGELGLAQSSAFHEQVDWPRLVWSTNQARRIFSFLLPRGVCFGLTRGLRLSGSDRGEAIGDRQSVATVCIGTRRQGEDRRQWAI